MGRLKILTDYLLPLMLHILVVTGIAAVCRRRGIATGYGSAIGIVLIVLSGASSAFWGVRYQCRVNYKSGLEIIGDFFDVRQSAMSYLLAGKIVVYLKKAAPVSQSCFLLFFLST